MADISMSPREGFRNLFLLEGGAVLGVVGTMLSGYWPTALVAVLPLIGMLRCTPESLEQHSFSA